MTLWSPQQDAALIKVKRWLDAPRGTVPQVMRLEGYAGTGKTTLAREVMEQAGGPGPVRAAAYTGKAASVMARKGLPGASTIHRLIYTPAGNEAERLLRDLEAELLDLERVEVISRALELRREALRRQLQEAQAAARQPQFVLKERSDLERARLVIIDEHTMINERMGLDLLSFGCPVLALGDPAQLPPVRGVGFFTEGPPDVLLTEVHRQAADSPIIHLATAVREGRPLPRGDWGEARVTDRVSAEEAMAADQILCGTNARRRAINMRHRDLGGHGNAHPMPRAGERLVCLRNDHELGLLNGTLWDADEDATWEPGDDTVGLRIRPDTGGEVLGVPAEASIFIDEDQKPQWGTNQQFTYGYCLTVHKSQGSQWDSVVLFDDWPKRSDSYRNWLYTGVTRAAERLVVVQL